MRKFYILLFTMLLIYSLKWKSFKNNFIKSLSLLRQEESLYDVTLVGDDHKQMSAHKLVLSACSEYFKDIFSRTDKQFQLMLCLDGVNSGDLNNVLEYIYNGEVKICQNGLDRFLEVAQRFKLEGLTGTEDVLGKSKPKTKKLGEHYYQEEKEIHVNDSFQTVEKEESSVNTNTSNKNNPKSEEFEQHYYQEEKEIHMDDSFQTADKEESPVNTISSKNVSLIYGDFSDITKLEKTIEENVFKDVDGKWKCGKCPRIANHKVHIKEHVETHIEGLAFPCQDCDKTFRTRHSLRAHKNKIRLFCKSK